MQRVFVLDKKKQPLMPCHPARARELLRKKRAAVWRLKPFTIILKDRVGGDTQATELKYDAGSKVTGIALVVHGAQGAKVAWAAHLHHRGQAIRDALLSRRGIRRSRRHRKTRYRAPRFLNRTPRRMVGAIFAIACGQYRQLDKEAYSLNAYHKPYQRACTL